ncbi:MAG TPA: hypothetical protein PK379_08605 [Candidatus Hydrogenedentes bacterium]|nr:hypothetical protein [Candidatus Hydrogenedentota bacterium]HOK90074.1 hypothetical protein [Candidatus Hydrogenedentota bacterium]HOV60415.1 hypothetical protein [Candidatus Hydrogenedentota bacterium]
MSSHVVATPVAVFNPGALVAVGSGLLALGATAYLARGVARALEEAAQAAREEAEQRKQAIEAWHRLREKVMASREEEAEAEAMVASVERRLAAMTLGEAAATLNLADTSRPMDRPAWLDLSIRGPAPDWNWQQALDEITSTLNQVKAAPAGVPAAVIDALLAQGDAMRRRAARGVPPDYEEILSFGKAVDTSVREAREAARRRHQAFEAFSTAAEVLLDKLLYLEALADGLLSLEETPRNELRALKEGLSAMLAAGEAKPGALELVQDRVEALRLAIETAAITEHHYAGLVESLQRNLRAMGYDVEEAFPDRPRPGATQHLATFAIPGGERLRAAVDRHGRLNFEVEHVRGAGESPDTPLTSAEQLLFLRQEARWCADARELLRRMAADGFSFEISLEKKAEAERVRVAVVNTGRELLDAEEETGTEHRRQARME